MSESREFETSPVSPDQLQPARYFAASYAGEHVAGTEFVIGALFVAWGVGTSDILFGLLLGNLLAVLTWGLVCAPIATDTRLTLYAYLSKIAGQGTIKLYSVVSGVLFCVLAGAMITVSASAVRIIFDIPAQTHWYPNSIPFVIVALAVGAVVVSVAIKGFKYVARFSEVCAPWMILMFISGALALYPVLKNALMATVENPSFFDVADSFIWKGDKEGVTFWHVAAFAWICNLSMHGGLSDMTVLRFARKSRYGFFSAFGMYIGHYIAWVCAGIMGAGAALILKSEINQIDPGAVAYEALGVAGIVAVVIAGWTTSNPTIYRAGLAFHSLNPKWSRTKVTLITGILTTIIACFPFVFSKLMDFVGLMGLLLAPVGAIIVTEHWFFKSFNLTRYWSHYAGNTTNVAAVLAWLLSLGFAWVLHYLGLHLYFLLVPTWIFATVLYILLARTMGAAKDYAEDAVAQENVELNRKIAEQNYLNDQASQSLITKKQRSQFSIVLALVAIAALIACLLMAVSVFTGASLHGFKAWLWLPSLVYFAAACTWAVKMSKASS